MEEKKEIKKLEKGRYIEGIGRRKTAVARVRIFEESGAPSFHVNEKNIQDYFPTEEMKGIAHEALAKGKGDISFSVSAKIVGGGIHAQAEALRLGLSRALVFFDEELRKKFKKAGLLKRDPRMVERKKFGRKKARKSGQWSKR
ncbi:MAG: 30S ribosomal protein S9 [Candidatus Paceibacterota bacterium]